MPYFDNSLQQYRRLLGAWLPHVVAEQDRGDGRAVFIVEAEWPFESELNPGLYRAYKIEPSGPGKVLMAEIGTGELLDLDDINALVKLRPWQ